MLNLSFKEEKDLQSCKENIAGYYGLDNDILRGCIAKKYANSDRIETETLTFFPSFVDGMSTLYTNPFTRDSSLGAEDLATLNLNMAMSELETYLHISHEAGIYMKSETDFKALDCSQYLVSEDSKKVFIYSDSGSVLCFFEGVGIYENKTKTLVDVDRNSDPRTELNTDGTLVWEQRSKDLKHLPFYFIRYKGHSGPVKNRILDCQQRFITKLSWATYNLDAKFLTQVYYASDDPADETRKVADDIGNAKKTLQIGETDKIGTIDMGDIENTAALLELYDKMVQQMAVQYGVNKYAVSIIPSTALISTDSRKLELAYVNQKRRKWFGLFNEFEKGLFSWHNQVFGTAWTFIKISYEDIAWIE